MSESTNTGAKMNQNLVYAGNLHNEVTEEELLLLFNDYDPIHVKKYRRDQKCFAFVQLSTSDGVLQVIQKLDKTMFKGRLLIVRGYDQEFNKCPDFTKTARTNQDCESASAICKNKDSRREEISSTTNLPCDITKKENIPNSELNGTQALSNLKELRAEAQIFVSNIPYYMSEVELHNLFKEYDAECVQKLQRDVKCFAFVKLRSSEKVELAISKINGTICKGRQLLCRNNTFQRSIQNSSVSSEDNISLLGLKDAPEIATLENGVFDNTKAPGDRQKEEKYFADQRQPEIKPNAGAMEKEIFVSNLPESLTEAETSTLPEHLEPVCVLKQDDVLCSAVVERIAPQSVSLDVEQQNGTIFNVHQLTVQSMSSDNEQQPEKSSVLPGPMPELEYVPSDSAEDLELYFNKFSRVLTGPWRENSIHIIPLEMRKLFLTNMLRDCCTDMSWLADMRHVSGEVKLLVTNVYLQSPYFWAVLMNKDILAHITNLLYMIEMQNDQLPYLPKEDVQRGTRCLAQCVIFNEEEAVCNRCWVVDVILDVAIVYLLDYGITANVSIQSLRRLDKDHFWETPPLAQPFVLQKGCDCIHFLGTIITGKISGSCTNEPLILLFSKSGDEETVDVPLLQAHASSL
ncbi:tudor domain-containing protein 10 [Pelobates fuscus]|uniref:tudor domain-containing protein 10 n=1 Tax=Pelobates fuscus TaxID=191477 RepID=UPI002FE4F73B